MKLQVVVTIHEGRFFPSSPNSKVYVQCRFNNEILLTDPVEHTRDPIWDTELLWSIESKPLGFLRSQRAKLKLVCYSIDQYNHRTQLGYIMLDLRAALIIQRGTQKEPPATFMPLFNASKSVAAIRPQIKVGFGIFSGDMPPPSPPRVPRPTRVAKEKAASSPKTPPAMVGSVRKMPPFEQAENGSFQIGFSGPNWILNITVAFAENLDLLMSERNDFVGTESTGAESLYYFYFTLLGNNFITQTFASLSNPKFPSERISLRLRASEADLATFFKDVGVLPIHLCRAGVVLGYAEVPIFAVMETAEVEFDNRNADGAEIVVDSHHLPAWSRRRRRARVLERVYTIFNLHQELPVSVDSKLPGLGISIILAPDDSADDLERSSVERKTVLVDEPERVSDKKAVTFVKQHHYRFSMDFRSLRGMFSDDFVGIYLRYSYAPFGTSTPIQTHPQKRPRMKVKLSDTGEEEIVLASSLCLFEFVMSPDRLATYLEAVPLLVEVLAQYSGTDDVLVATALVDLSCVLRQPTGKVQSCKTISLATRYEINNATSPGSKFGDLVSILSLEDAGEVDDADGARAPTQTFFASPAGPPNPPTLEDNAHTKQTEAASSIPAESKRPVPVKSTVISELPSQSPLLKAPEIAKPAEFKPTTYVGSYASSVSESESIHESNEYRVALELEMWRREEARKFRAHLRSLETDLIERLTAEFSARDAERAATVARKLEAMSALEERARRLALDLESRERAVARSEDDIRKLKEDHKKEDDKRRLEFEEMVDRLREEFNARSKLELQKLVEADASRVRATKEREEAEEKLRRLERELEDARKALVDAQAFRQSSTKDETALTIAAVKSELAKVVAEAAATERKAEALDASRKQYKAQWIRALRELAKVKKNWQQEIQDRLTHEQRQMDVMKLKMLARDEMDQLYQTRRDLDGLKVELGSISQAGGSPRRGLGLNRDQGQKTNHLWSKTGQGGEPLDIGNFEIGADESSKLLRKKLSTAKENMDPNVYAEVERLATERDSLINSGVYQREDKLIRELDLRIQRLLTR
ncbi:hypothetical protein HDU97_002314 [Phlyctochytrium planicorne]|nr:hypothetical protein HDU97_002314 [Phlyctochytrium planicorne]